MGNVLEPASYAEVVPVENAPAAEHQPHAAVPDSSIGPVTPDGGDVLLVDDFGQPTGVIGSASAHAAATLHLGWACFLTNGSGSVLTVQQASDLQPGSWSVSARGHAVAGERIACTISKAVARDLGLLISDLRVILPAFRYQAELPGRTEHELCPVFLATATGQLNPASDVLAAEWLPWARMRDEILFARRPATRWCTLQVAALTRHPDDPGEWAEGPLRDLPPALVYESSAPTDPLPVTGQAGLAPLPVPSTGERQVNLPPRRIPSLPEWAIG